MGPLLTLFVCAVNVDKNGNGILSTWSHEIEFITKSIQIRLARKPP
jgi:hypothetical protein